ncbi:sugar-binding transcriptional regulator [Brachybacterium fresconis]|uniref:DNA-binding transcriptional regulator LsrR (DeoR family) n=1 Tax=Brachybacterium fresconis TaxID=173363 RepID=A0ABS4YFK0_9MICO|nr:sugar-binding domain-containing protein [Brachybacterium fresconis]MBP2407576.1 DNA-binding transcriptional regulator LsrR (DeoR family) [Brachybacterium fresconis]
MTRAGSSPPQLPHPGDEDRALRAAVAYHLEGKTMDAVARELRVSRATVSRLLARARETGIVEITVFTPGARASQLSTELHDRHGVEALVVPLQERIPVEERHARTAEAAADALRQVVTSDGVLAVAWGTMTHAISLHLHPKAVTNCSVVQVNGMGNSAGIGVHYAHAMMDRFGHAFGARVQENPLPLFLDSAEVAAMLRADRLLSGVTQAIETADLFLFNVGTVTGGVPSAPHLYGNYLGDAEYDTLREDGAVADIATTFFDAQGRTDPIRLNAQSTGPDLDALCAVKRRICVTSGVHKVEALSAALAGGYITDLIIDEHTAHALLDAER